MRWPARRGKAAKHAQRRDAVVMSVTTALTRETALELAKRLDRVDADAPVVIDLTAIPAFDSDGADTLLQLQQARGVDRLSIVGFRQATARLVGPPEVDPLPPPLLSGWAVRRLRNLVVVQPAIPASIDPADLEHALESAVADRDAAIVVVDLLGIDHLPPAVVEAMAFASSTVALNGQEMLVVNVGASIADALRLAGLSATTYVAPQPPLDPSTG